jgi:hypothetical protein
MRVFFQVTSVEGREHVEADQALAADILRCRLKLACGFRPPLAVQQIPGKVDGDFESSDRAFLPACWFGNGEWGAIFWFEESCPAPDAI